MRNRRWLWAVAVIVTLGSAVFQRMTGPTYPVRGHVTLGSRDATLKLTRTHGGPGDQPVRLVIPDRSVDGSVEWRRYPTGDPWASLPLVRNGDVLETALPHQPVAGKVEYQVRLTRGDESAVFPALPAISRFRDAVPDYVLVPHVAAMFLAMLFSTAAGLSAWGRWPHVRRESYICVALFAVGGFMLGPLMQKIAFGDWWTGIPFGWDLTDNKTLFAALAWVWAVWQLRGGRDARTAVIAASILTLIIFAVPHSTWGSEHKWDTAAPTSQTR